jgi:hypothetical protein
VSPTAPTFGTLNDQLNKAHHRIRELEARETELLAHNRTLCAVITELTHDDDARAAELTSLTNDGSDGFGIGDRVPEHTSQRLGPAPRAQTLAPPGPSSVSPAGTTHVKTRRFPYV